MELTEAAVVVAAGAGAVSAAAAALSARASRQAVVRAHRPFVWAEIHVVKGRRDDKMWLAKLRLHNDGPGAAFDVSAAVGPHYVYERVRRHWWQVWSRTLSGYATPPIRAMRPGEAVPPRDSDEGLYELAIGSLEDWWVAVRYTDAAGVRWEFREPRSPESLARPAHRLRARWWQLWRRPLWW
jgi:hypothetical protein